jgi:hypothetical protein
MRFCFSILLLLSAPLGAQTTLQLHPDVVTECSSFGLGSTTVSWNSPGNNPVQVLVGPARVSMTGPVPATGSADTEDWVSDGLSFVLADATGGELARATARVKCSPFPDPIGAALAANSYFPLQAGNEWVYRLNDRVLTSDYLLVRIPGVRIIGEQAWYVVLSSVGSTPPGEVLYRADPQGRIYQLDSQGREVLYLDPTPSPDPAATLKILNGRGRPFRNALGSFADSLAYTTTPSLILETGLLVRGVGRISSTTNMLSGSSGGFLRGLDLVYARIGANIRFATPAISVALSVESSELDVSGSKVSNCAVPCYFVACGLVPGADPPGTYKPCFQTRVRLENLGVQDSTALDLDLLDPAGLSVFHTSVSVPAGQAQPDSIVISQIKLYTAPNQPVPPGKYSVQAKAKLSTGTDVAVATIPVQVR